MQKMDPTGGRLSPEVTRRRLVAASGRMLGLALMLAASATFAAPPEKEPDPEGPAFELINAEFGIFDVSNAKNTVFTPTRIVPHRQDQRYGWVIELRSRKRSLSVREEYLLPNPPRAKSSDELSESLNIETPRHNQISQRQLVPVDGKIYGEWAIGSSEPAGHRQLQVVIENEVAASFEFDVKDVK